MKSTTRAIIWPAIATTFLAAACSGNLAPAPAPDSSRADPVNAVDSGRGRFTNICLPLHGRNDDHAALCEPSGSEAADLEAVFLETFDNGSLDAWSATCNADQFGRLPDICGEPDLDHGEFFCSAPSSLHLFDRGSCLDPPFDGLSTTVSRTVRIPNGDYRVVYGARILMHHYAFCQGATSGSLAVTVNGVTAPGVSCGIGLCGTCFIDWTRRSACFTVTDGTADISIVNTAGDCADVNGWVDDLALEPLAELSPQFPADVTIGCGESTDPSNTGGASATGGCAPSISFTDTVTGTCPGLIERLWTITDQGASISQVQRITLAEDFASDTDHDGVPAASDLCPGTPPGETVDATGCSCRQRVQQTCVRVRGTSDNVFASCVRASVDTCVADGLVSPSEGNALIKAIVNR